MPRNIAAASDTISGDRIFLMVGQRFAHYEITSHVGSGGMGDVYEARDTTLGRRVAIKVLPEAFADHPDRAARFEREARVLASLNHPHIAAIHGLEEAGGRRFLVMELVSGQTLEERIAPGPLALDDALHIARQIADALEAAHEKGIVHRDLKPANVKITAGGQVKVLDFGLAKVAETQTAPDEHGRPTHVQTTVTAPTEAGVILGTAAYMAPEQAKGHPVDRRADLFAFGCVLYEMLTGRRAFEGETFSDTLSRVLQRDPDWARLPPDVPPSVQRLLRLCLEKDPRRRRQSAGDVRVDLEQAMVEPVAAVAAAPRGSRWPRLAGIAGAALLAAGLAIPAAIHLLEAPPAEVRLQLVTPPTRQPLHFALSPNGRLIVFVASGSPGDGRDRLYLRALDEIEAHPLSGTEGARHPFWSADGRSIGFFAGGQLLRVDITGGQARALAPASNSQGGTWNADGTILFAPNTVSPLLRVPASGGEPVSVTQIEGSGAIGHLFPDFLPDGRRFLFVAQGEPDVAGVYLGSLDGGPPTRLTADASVARYLAPDHVLFVRQGELVAQRFDSARGVLTGDPATLSARGADDATLVGAFSASAGGTLAYRASSGIRTRLTWFDGTRTVLDGVDTASVEISPDGRRLALDRTVQGNRDVWLRDLERGGLTRFTFHPAVDGYPVWSPDGSQIAFHSTRNGTFDIWIKSSSGVGAETLLLETPDHEWPIQWSRDGRYLLFQRSDVASRWDLWALPMTGDDRTPIAVATTPFAERMGELSPNSRWVAYETNESGRPEIVAQAFPDPTVRVQVSTAGGEAPRWRADGAAIYFLAPDGTMMLVPVVATASSLEPGTPVELFRTEIGPHPFRFNYAVTRDGRFLVNNLDAEDAASPITVLLNWSPR